MRLTTRQASIIISSIVWVISLAWIVYEVSQGKFPFEPLVLFLSGFLALLIPLIERLNKSSVGQDRFKAYEFDSERHLMIRQNVIASVNTAYVEGYLRHALHENVRVELELSDVPKALRSPIFDWQSGKGRARLMSDTDIDQIFSESGEALLILGAPGAGKTIALLELCRALLLRAKEDVAEPVPIVLNLASWEEKQQDIGAWIVTEMSQKYRLSTKVTPAWIENDHFCLLLDGLDEVEPVEARENCVKAINEFLKTHDPPIAVCSRVQDYEMLSERLSLTKAVNIEPLGEEQVEAFLTDERMELGAVYTAVKENEALRALSKTPLVLNIMALAYRGKAFDEVQSFGEGSDELIRHLYKTYIARQFERRKVRDAAYKPEKALYWLRFLASKLTEENEFFVEDLQPDWLPAKHLRRFKILSSIAGVLVSIVFGLFIGLLIGELAGPSAGVFFFIQVAVWFGVLFGDLGARGDRIEPAESLYLPRPNMRDLRRNWSGALYGGCFGGAYGGLVGYHNGDVLGLAVGVFVGVLVGIVVGVIVDSVEARESEYRSQPNQGIRRSARRALGGGLTAGLFVGVGVGVIGLIVGGIFGGAQGAQDGSLYGVLTGFVVGFFVAILFFGGMVVIRHYLLRAMLHRAGLLPFGIVRFCEAMTQHILLLHGGPQFRFIHGTFRDYLASLTHGEFETILAATSPSQ